MTYKLIETLTVPATPQSGIDFQNIPATYTDLLILASLRNNDSNQAGNVLVELNGSTSSFSNIFWQGNGVNLSQSSVSAMVGDMNTAFDPSGVFNNILIYFGNYASSNSKNFFAKAVQEMAGVNAFMQNDANLWSNSAAINRITLRNRNAGINFVQYSSASLYGIRNS
jgi:hypothetical protein